MNDPGKSPNVSGGNGLGLKVEGTRPSEGRLPDAADGGEALGYPSHHPVRHGSAGLGTAGPWRPSMAA